MSSQPTLPRLRSAHTKSRTGCRTCKIRRVKCDEGRPACKRCTSTGRICDGYEAVMATKSWTVVTGPSPALSTNCFPDHFDDDASKLSFEFFCAVSATELSGFFGRTFWRQTLLCASHQFRPIKSALLAVATLHRRFKGIDQNVPRLVYQPVADELAGRQYGKALRHLIRDMEGVDKPHCRLVSLICGMLFSIIEVLQGNDNQALVHLDGIIKLLDEKPKAATGEVLVTDIEQELRPVISRLDVEASLFAIPRPPRLSLPPLASFSPRHSVTLSVDQAADELNNLMAHMSYFKRTQATGFRYGTAGDIPLPVLHTQQTLISHFERWWISSAFFLAGLNSAGAILLRIHYYTAWTMLQCCLEPEETLYDRYQSEFAEVVRLCAVLTEIRTQEGTLGRIFSSETGIIFPLYWAALRCRDGTTRRAALSQLRTCSREGVWTPEIHACVAQRAIEIEEGLAPGALTLEDPSAKVLPSLADIPEFRRIHCVGLDMDKPNSRVRMTYQRLMNGPDGEWNIVQEWSSY